jgi:hypothetical protein
MGNELFGAPRKARPAERPKLERRRARLEQMKGAVGDALTALAALTGDTKLTEVKIRDTFVYATKPATVTGRRTAPRDQRPPATRLFAPTGSALGFYLLALYEAQTRLATGQVYRNPWPVTGSRNPDQIGWTDLLVTPAADSAIDADWVATVADKKYRTLYSVLSALLDLDLVRLPNAGATKGVLEQFRVLNERGLRTVTHEDGPRPIANKPYRVPTEAVDYFAVPAAFFTRGWIHVLEDTEIALLLIVCYWQTRNPGQPFRIPTAVRDRRHCLGRDAYSDSARILASLGLIHVEADQEPRATRATSGHGNRWSSRPHEFLLKPDGFDTDADLVLLQHLRDLLR